MDRDFSIWRKPGHFYFALTRTQKNYLDLPAPSGNIRNSIFPTPLLPFLHFLHAPSKLNFSHVTQRIRSTMLLARDYVGYIATEIVKRLVEGGQIETEAINAVALRLRQRMNEELSVEDRLNDEVRQILTEHQDEMRRTGVSYQEMYKKVKGQLARDRKLVLR